MRNVRYQFPRALMVLAVGFAAACASGAANTPDAAATPSTPAQATPGAISLRVINTHSSGDDLRVYLQPQAGAQKQLGNVVAAATLNAPFNEAPGRYRFAAERPNGTTVTSPYFDVQLAGVYVWDINTGRVTRMDR